MAVKLTQQDVSELKKQGYSDDEIAKAVGEIEKEDLSGSANPTRQDPRSNSQTSAFSSKNMDDIARYQLELNDLLEQTEHILKGDVVKWEDGMKVWKENPHPELNPLNTEGIRKIMLDLQYYINRHIILGDYEENDINRIMKEYGKKVNNFIFMKYEEMGMDTEEKRQEYASIVMNVVNLVYASYSRAKDGGERRSLREMISIQQNHQSQDIGGGSSNGVQRSRGVLNPMRYLSGKNA
jgi:hypothetical protein